jgi:hypothetical protein
MYGHVVREIGAFGWHCFFIRFLFEFMGFFFGYLAAMPSFVEVILSPGGCR